MLFKMIFSVFLLINVAIVWSEINCSELLSSVVVPVNCSIPAYEYLALYDLYESTNGIGWAWRSTQYEWNFSGDSDPCLDNWEGLSCSSSTSSPSTLPSNTYHIESINLTSYRMVGSIPPSIGVFSNLSILSLGDNVLTNSIPSSVGNLTTLIKLRLYQNKLNGTIPHTMGNLTKLEIMEMKNNSFTGSLPESFSALKNLLLLDVYLNQLTGTVPYFISKLLQLQYLDIYENKHHGTIPSYLGNLHFLRYLYLGKNALTGTIPDMFANLQNLVSFYANTNKLVGTVPSSFSQLPNLQFLFLHENGLVGNLDKVFNSSVQKKMKNVILYDNKFTGNLPEQLFNISSVEVVDCGNNCLDGALPQTICASKSLKTLSLDGMCAAASCRDYVFSARTQTYVLRHTIAHSIPQCLLELPQLETLHISGNGVSGSLPPYATLSDTFTDLALSQNFITGELPLYIQTRKWSSLDLNNNRVRGTLSPDFVEQSSTAQLKLANNRLSGPIPESIIDATGTVSILDGNLFECNYLKSDLPEEDNKRNSYECGSNTFNLSMYVWLGVALIMIGILSIFAVGNRDSVVAICKLISSVLISQAHLLDEWDLPGPGAEGKPLKFQLRRYRRICDMCKLCRRLGIAMMLFIVCILMPLYALLSLSAGTLTYQYAYKVSVIYLSGKVAAGLAMSFLLILLLFTFNSFVILLRKYRAETVAIEKAINFVPTDASYRESYSPEEKSNWAEKILVCVALIAVDLIVVFGGNIGFVYFAIYGSEDLLPFVQLALSVFKIGWCEICSMVVYYLSVCVDFQSKRTKRIILSLFGIITVFNNIVVPSLVVMAISTTCFYNLAIQPKNIQSSYEYRECTAYDVNGCYAFAMIPHESSFSPPFVYSYQCSASIITYYAPSFMYVCIISGFIIPLARYTLYHLVRVVPEDGCVYWCLRKIMPLILQPIRADKKPYPSLSSPFFDARTQLTSLYNNLAIVLTFGAMFPPLAVAVTALNISMIFRIRSEVKRFLQEATQKNLPEYLKIIDQNCIGIGSDRMLLRGTAMLVMLGSCFYTLFIFDTLGDKVKFSGAYWVLIVMPVFPITLMLVFMFYAGPKLLRAKRTITNSVNRTSKVVQALQEILKQQDESATIKSPITQGIEMRDEFVLGDREL